MIRALSAFSRCVSRFFFAAITHYLLLALPCEDALEPLNDLIALGDGKPFYPVNLCNSLDKASQSARVVVPSQFVA